MLTSSPPSQIIRSDYTDEFYGDLACTSIRRWREVPYVNRYHESGTVIACNETHEQRKYVTDALAVNTRPGMQIPGKRAYQLHSPEEIKAMYPPEIETGELKHLVACECLSAPPSLASGSAY